MVDNVLGVVGVFMLVDVFLKCEEGFVCILMFSVFIVEEIGLFGVDYFVNNLLVLILNMVVFLNIDGMNVNDDVDYIL